MRAQTCTFLVVLVSLAQQSICNGQLEKNGARKSLFKVEDAKKCVAKRNKFDDVKFFEGISESAAPTSVSVTPTSRSLIAKHHNVKDESLTEIKSLLERLLDKIEDIEVDPKKLKSTVGYRESHYDDTSESCSPYSVPTFTEPTSTSRGIPSKLSLIQRIERKRRKKERKEEEKRQRWGKWTNWSPCSVSCGKGREIRWRHCLENCDIAETEMEEKTCQLPACGPSKLFGVIKL